ncbi:MAG TPA: lipocalin-like domain-containing protein [Acidisphaera sp.]|nr:lipocalin-like domain-containing protein [Acidisphaera sp.]
MNRRRLAMLGALGLLAAGPGIPAASAQTAREISGTYAIASTVNTAPDGKKTEPFGADPKGAAVFGRDGRFVIVLSRADLPKFASGNRMQGTADENKAIVQGGIGYFGTWSVAGKVLTLHIDGGSWPAWTGTDQKREIVAFNKRTLTLNVPASIGGTTVTVWRRTY